MLRFLLTSFLICCIIMFIEIDVVDSSMLTKEIKLKEFIKHNSSLTTEQAGALAEKFIGYGYDRAKWLAATAKVEADFMPNARGTSGEVSMFQILDWPRDKDPTNIDHAIEEALKVLEQKESLSKSQFEAIRRYNGSPKNPKTRYYANKVTKIMRYL